MSNLKELRKKANQIEEQLDNTHRNIEKQREKLGSITRLMREQLIPEAEKEMAQKAASLAQLANDRTLNASMASWESDYWNKWTPDYEIGNSLLRIGELSGNIVESTISLPAYVPYIGKGQTVAVPVSSSEELSLFHSLLIRSAILIPNQVSYTLLDPAHNGLSFPMNRLLPGNPQVTGDIRRSLDDITKLIYRRISEYIDAKITSFEKLDYNLRLDEPFHLIFAADFPQGYDRRSIEVLQSIANTGPTAGVYLFLHYNTTVEFPRGIDLEGFDHLFFAATLGEFSSLKLTIHPDQAPSHELQEHLFKTIADAKPPEEIVDASFVIPDKTEWWCSNSTEMITTSIGKMSGHHDPITLWFGQDEKGNACSHGLLGGMTGSGKSVCLHTLICSLAARYAPDQLRLYLVDGKNGVEFQAYQNLPHAEVISLRTSAEMARSLLDDLFKEMERRNELFVDAGVNDLQAFRNKGFEMPRILLIADEYQILFEEDRDGLASTTLRQLAEQGRSTGIHLLLGSQSFTTAGMNHRSLIFANIHLRMAMRLTEEARKNLTDFGREGKELIQNCEQVGQIVVNTSSGADGKNSQGKVAFIDKECATQIVEEILSFAKARKLSISAPIIIDGYTQPSIESNPLLQKFISTDTWMSESDKEGMVRRSSNEGGFGILDWYSTDRPYIAFLGQDFSVRGQASVIFRRQAGQNLLFVGADQNVRSATIAAIVTSLAANAAPDKSSFYMMEGLDETDILDSVQNHVLRPSHFVSLLKSDGEQIEEILHRMLQLIDERKTMSSREIRQQPSIFLVLVEPDRIPELRRTMDHYGDFTASSLGKELERVVIEGPEFGIHTIASFAGLPALRNILDIRKSLSLFRHRILLQMNEDDAYTLTRNRSAATLQAEGPRPVRAIYRDMVTETTLRFKPYITEARRTENGADLETSITQIGAQLAKRK